ncbi:estradiol 17-beta-dehydrogenase 8-like [Penaeus chinensis]|uniref:estradiol 17-beta-dehydrogenase 8-like n=1 Tax=Penaeus chinensis TaxID=139456 RepID=UPI001FB63026|nr:estradiol 17-beta-dehydrogenase 8-like [Penaeus chinensis]
MSSVNEFSGKVALVTGGGSGIGRAVCQVLARDGARVSVCDINLKAAQETVESLKNPGDHIALCMDVSNKEQVHDGLRVTQEKMKATPTLLVNCAGMARPAPFLEMTEERFMQVINVNLKGTFLVSQAVCNAMLDRNEAKGGAVVNIASVTGKTGLPTNSQYAASKGGVMAFTKSCAKELAKTGIRVNCIMPGPIRTPMLAFPQEIVDEFLQRNPLGRCGEPEEVAEMVAFLLSEKSSYLLGSCVEVTGGHDM